MPKVKKKIQITEYWKNIPSYNGSTETWSFESFDTKAEFRTFLEDIFIEDGPETGYEFDESTKIFNAEATKFSNIGHFCEAPEMSKDFLKYWDTQSERCRNGIIVYGKNGRTWYLARDYYMWINFLPIYHKEKRDFLFPDIYDGQYHTALYETLAELKSKHAIILKKRQYAMSYYHMAKLINQVWFEKGVTLKLLAYLDEYIGEKGSWAFLNEYRDFLNDNTAWYRSFVPDTVGSWNQRIKTTINGRDAYKGRKGRVLGITTKQSATNGVGGASRFIIAEESGINPTLDKTYGYAKSALEAGPFAISGQFIAYGSVGDLKQCDPLKQLMNRAEENGFFGVKTKLYDNKEIERVNGLFIPETWNMLGFMDEYGNSDTKAAKKALLEKRIQQKKDLEPDAYQLEVSQHPLTISEAFDWREEAIFPLDYVNKQIQRIEDGEYPSEFIDLYEDEKGIVISKLSKDRPIMVFPVDKKMVNKEGVIVVYERPDIKPVWGTYYASIDPVGEGETHTSNSLCSIVVYKNAIEVIKHLEDGSIKSHIEGDKIVCTWCGRFNDLNKTHERLEFIIRWYNAWTLVEANISHFIVHMISRKMQHFLVPKDQILFLKELTSNNGFHEYGWKNVSTIFKNNLLPYGIQFLKDEINIETEIDGTIIRIHFGAERIPDKMLLVEMKEYRPGMNVDRIVSYVALIAFVKIQQANIGFKKKIEYVKNLEKPINYSRLKLNPYRHIGGNSMSNSKIDPQYKIKRSAFNNHR